MNKTESYRYFLDSSAWLSYFLAENQQIKDVVEEEYLLFTSALSIFEIKKKLILLDKPQEVIFSHMQFIKSKSLIVEANLDICEKAADISIEEKLHAVDAIIYSSAINSKSILVTGNPHFKGKKDILLLK